MLQLAPVQLPQRWLPCTNTGGQASQQAAGEPNRWLQHCIPTHRLRNVSCRRVSTYSTSSGVTGTDSSWAVRRISKTSQAS